MPKVFAYLHDAAAFAVLGEGEKVGGQADHFAQPVQDDRLQFRAGRTGRLRQSMELFVWFHFQNTQSSYS